MSAHEEVQEVWLPVLGYEGLYDASNLGRIRNARSGLILKPAISQRYLHVSLCKAGEIKTMRVHVAVLSAFCGPRPFDGAAAAHNDGDTNNCRLSNLRWTSPIENQADVDRHGRRCRGEAVYGAKLTEPQVLEIRKHIRAGKRNPQIAPLFGVSISTVHLIRHNRIWSHVNG